MRARRSGRTFSFMDERKKKGERGRRDATGERTGRAQWSTHNNGSKQLRKMKRHDVKCTKDGGYVSTHTYVYAYTRASVGHLLVMSYFVPRRTAHGDYRLTITSVSGIPVTPSFITTYRSPTDYA